MPMFSVAFFVWICGIFFDGNYLGTVKISENCPFIFLTFQSKII